MANTKLLLAAAAIFSFGAASAQAQPFQKLGNPAQSFSSGHVQMCAGVAPVTVLAVEDQYGSGGGAIPTRLDYQINDNAFIPAFGGGEITAGMSTNLPMGGNGAMLTLKGKIAYPSFDDPQEAEAHPHTNPVNVIVLKNGDTLTDVLANKQVEAPFGSQQRIDQILAQYLNGDVVVLPPGQTIQLYEFGLLTPDTEALDYQDLVLKVGYRCTHGQDVLLRNSIGPNHYQTQGNIPFATAEGISAWFLVISRFDADRATALKELRAIVAQTSDDLNFAAYDYRILVWSSRDAAMASPMAGDIFTSENIAAPDVGPTLFGETGPIPVFGVKPTWEVHFDLDSLGIVVPAGADRYIGLYVLHGGGGNGALGIVESAESGASDSRMGSSGNTIYLTQHSGSHHSGRVGIELRGTSF